MKHSDSSKHDTYQARKEGLLFLGPLGVLFLLYLILIRLNVLVEANILYSRTLLVELTEWGYLAVELLAMLFTYATVLSYTIREGERYALRPCLVYAAFSFLRYIALTLWIDGAVSGLNTSDLIEQLGLSLLNYGLDILQLSLILLLCSLSAQALKKEYQTMQKGAALLNRELMPRTHYCYPYVMRPMRQDAAKRAACLICGLLCAFRVSGRMIYDFNYGAPTELTDALWMILYYTVDILIGIGGYFFILWIYKQNQKNI